MLLSPKETSLPSESGDPEFDNHFRARKNVEALWLVVGELIYCPLGETRSIFSDSCVFVNGLSSNRGRRKIIAYDAEFAETGVLALDELTRDHGRTRVEGS